MAGEIMFKKGDICIQVNDAVHPSDVMSLSFTTPFERDRLPMHGRKIQGSTLLEMEVL